MTKPMPYQIIKHYKNMDNINLDDFFGFCLVEVYCPIYLTRPLLPYKHKGKTIFPRGSWTGVYFSEELKAVKHLGYKFKLISAYEFSKIDLFSKYVIY